MGGPRASTVRQIHAGKICTLCRAFLEVPTGRETICDRCKAPTLHRVYCYFQNNNTWAVCFLEPDLKTLAGTKPWYTTDVIKVRDLFDQYGASKSLEDVQAFEYGIDRGRGSFWLNLPHEHYLKLKAGR